MTFFISFIEALVLWLPCSFLQLVNIFFKYFLAVLLYALSFIFYYMTVLLRNFQKYSKIKQHTKYIQEWKSIEFALKICNDLFEKNFWKFYYLNLKREPFNIVNIIWAIGIPIDKISIIDCSPCGFGTLLKYVKLV